MRKIREILRLRFAAGLTIRQIKASTKLSVGAIQKLLTKAQELALSWPLPDDLDDAKLAQLFYPKADPTVSPRFHIPNWPELHHELKQKGITRQLLWEEYTAQHPNRCYSYSQFCDRYHHWRGLQKRSMRQTHKAGEKSFVDYCGPTVPVVNAATGEIINAQVFVGVLGASNYTFAEATASQSSPDWLGSHVRMFEYYGGCTEIVVPDNLRSGVSRACRYDPDINPGYQQLAEHYGVVIIPARPYKPKDKSKAEVGVQIVERWIIARLRKLTFFSLVELNQCIRVLLEDLNSKPFKALPGNRKQAFEKLDKPALKPLPVHPYRYVEIKKVKVNIDYHIQFEQHNYSVPHEYVGEHLECHASDTLIRCFFKQRQIAAHPRKYYPGTTTDPAHMPKSHQKHQQWSPGRMKNWAKDIGPEVLIWIGGQFDRKKHPELAYRACLGLLNLSHQYPSERLNAACKIANKKSLFKLKQIKSILKSNLDKLPEQLDLDVELPQEHENIRGPNHYH